jgi:O-methyltransferase involved in polyketide biosynthesis
VADLGGGTGFILKELLKQQEFPKTIHLVNVDTSPLQLSEIKDHRIKFIKISINQITRKQLQPNKKGLMLISRSILHYFGEEGLKPLLQHIRSQLKTGEIFIHQTACFQDIRDAQCLNLLYKLMTTEKWYTTVNTLKSILTEVGFYVYDICQSPNLQLDSTDLTERYHLNPHQITLIQKQIEQQYGQKPLVYTCSPDHFKAWLHYNLFSCRAI